MQALHYPRSFRIRNELGRAIFASCVSGGGHLIFNVMKHYFFVISVALPLSINAWAGNFLFKSMYSEHNLVQGEGLSLAEATADASSAMPVLCHNDPGNSPAWECTESNVYFAKTGTQGCDVSIPGNRYQITIPLLCE